MNVRISRICTISRAALLGIALLGLVPAAQANDAADCRNSGGYTKIDACTRLIDSGRLQGAALAAAYGNRAAGKLQKEIDPAGTLADLNRAIELDPNVAKYHMDRGLAHVENGDAEAAADFSRVIELDPGNARAWYLRGVIKRTTEDYDGAIADFDQALKLEPQQVSAYDSRGLAKVAKHDLTGAIADFTREIELRNRNTDESPEERDAALATAYFYRADARADSGDHDRAIADFTLAIKYNPEYALAYTGRGKEKWFKGDPKGSMEDMDQAIKLRPNDAPLYALRGAAKGDSGDDYDGAIADFNRALELNPKFAPVYLMRGVAKNKHGDAAGALADFNAVIKLDPSNADAYTERGKARHDSGDLDGAIADLNRSLELDPKNGEATKVRGMMLFLKGQAAQAAQDLALAQKIEPDTYTAIWLYLARMRAKADGARELGANTAKLERKKWPSPVVALYLGKATPASAFAAARDANPKTQKEQQCEADFYIAQWYLLKDDRKSATPLLREAVEICPDYYIEGNDATTQLKQLGIALK